MNKPIKTPEDVDRVTNFYSEHLKFLWEQYNKVIGFGVLSSGATLVLLILFAVNPEIREVIKTICNNSKEACLNPFVLKIAVLSLFVATISFIGCRWCSQILMERQIYGNAEDALYFFEKILENETVLPSALTPKEYSSKFFINRINLLKFVGSLNELTKFSGIILTLIGWISALCYFFPLLDI